MTDKLHCPFCGAELETMFGISESVLGCSKCKHIATIGIWESLIDGKKAQGALKAAKEYYVIVRGYDKIQHYVSYSTGAEWYWNWDLDHAEPFDTIQDAKDQIRAAKIPHARVMKVCRLTEITSKTKQDNK